MIILGIDPGLTCTGFGLIKTEEKKLKPIDYGCLLTLSKIPTSLRLKKIYQAIRKIIKKYQPDLCVVEKLFFAKNTKTAMKVGEARGVILLALAEKEIPLIELTPLETKMSLTNFGRASKRQIQKIVKLILQLKKLPESDDAADALALAICGAKILLHKNRTNH